MGSLFEQALVARRQTDFHFTVTTCLSFEPKSFQQAAGLIHYYNGTKFYYLHISAESGIRQLQLMCASPECEEGMSLEIIQPLPPGTVELGMQVEGDRLTFAWRLQGAAQWAFLPGQLDASIMSDEVTCPGLPNFTGAFVGMSCQDLSGAGTPADFSAFVYEEGGDLGAQVD